jgi:6-phosphofructokinase 1
VAGVIQRGGTFLGTSRLLEFREASVRALALEQLRARAVDALIVIGGNGTQSGAAALAREGARVVGIASTIDNDVEGCDVSLGTTTALDIAIEAIDRLKVTAASIGRAFLVEVMGRDSGYLALAAAVAGGAEAVVVPERATSPEELAAAIRKAHEVGKAHAIVVVAEGAALNAEELSRVFVERHAELGFELRVTRLGHVQRGGAPGAFDRLLGSRLGACAVERLLAGEHGVVVGLRGADIASTPLDAVAEHRKPVPLYLFDLAATL